MKSLSTILPNWHLNSHIGMLRGFVYPLHIIDSCLSIGARGSFVATPVHANMPLEPPKPHCGAQG